MAGAAIRSFSAAWCLYTTARIRSANVLSPAWGSDRSTPALPGLTSCRSFLVLAVLLIPAQEIYRALLLQALRGTYPRYDHSPMQPAGYSASAGKRSGLSSQAASLLPGLAAQDLRPQPSPA